MVQTREGKVTNCQGFVFYIPSLVVRSFELGALTSLLGDVCESRRWWLGFDAAFEQKTTRDCRLIRFDCYADRRRGQPRSLAAPRRRIAPRRRRRHPPSSNTAETGCWAKTSARPIGPSCFCDALEKNCTRTSLYNKILPEIALLAKRRTIE